MARHGRRAGFVRRLRRRIFAYRDIELLPSHIPGIIDEAGAQQECLLLVHVRKVVGQVHYQACARCGEGVITDVDIDEAFHSTGLDHRAVSHLRSRHPDITWYSTLTRRTTRDLLRRMRILSTTGCAHIGAALAPDQRPTQADLLRPRRP
ncbi:hypothetical protein [Streptomyces vinaceus]|uniref:hypothetical protein n=1 Tax=Streptomyces vinaceus TaxID=1960 RepID=UPI00368E9294